MTASCSADLILCLCLKKESSGITHRIHYLLGIMHQLPLIRFKLYMHAKAPCLCVWRGEEGWFTQWIICPLTAKVEHWGLALFCITGVHLCWQLISFSLILPIVFHTSVYLFINLLSLQSAWCSWLWGLENAVAPQHFCSPRCVQSTPQPLATSER